MTKRFFFFKGSKIFWGFTFIISILWKFSLSQPSTYARSDYYEKGVTKRDSGDWQAALDIWIAARDSLANRDHSDPRIGIAFIELATEKKASDFYEDASEIYFWGFSQSSNKKFNEEIKDEIARISPLLEEEEASHWRNLLKRNDRRLIESVKSFWLRNDPIPTTEKNERLIEHWERIGYAKEKFNKEQTTVYGTDDRGLVFVKYGEPDKKLAGKLGTEQLEIMRWFPTDFLFRQEIQRYNNNPEVEIWIYSGLKKDEATVFLFGKKSGFGKYGLRYGVEDFIPERAFSRMSTRTTQGLMPGAFIQLMYYGELMSSNRFFMDRFRELEALWVNARAGGDLSPNRDVLLGLLSHYKSLDEDRSEFKFMAAHKTSTLEGIEKLDLNHKVFRYLSDSGTPMLKIFAVSDNVTVDENFRPIFFKTAERTKYKHRHVLLSYDKKWQQTQKRIHYPALKNQSTSVFDLEQKDSQAGFVLSAEKILFETRDAEIEKSDIPDTTNPIGIASAFLGQLQALSPDTTSLESSDLLVGGRSPELSTADYSLPVIPKDPVRNSDSLQVYLEFYHADAGAKSSVKTKFSFSLLENGSKEKRKKKMSKSFEFQVSPKKIWRVFAFDISKLSPGEYELTVEITSNKEKGKKIRTAYFQVVG